MTNGRGKQNARRRIAFALACFSADVGRICPLLFPFGSDMMCNVYKEKPL